MDSSDIRQFGLGQRIAASPEVVWRCLTDAELLPRWFGPDGVSFRTKEIWTGEGGQWRFDMIGPDGRASPRRHRYFGVQPLRQLEYWVDDGDDAVNAAHVQVTLTPGAGGTDLAITFSFPSTGTFRQAVKAGARDQGEAALLRLAALAEGL